jgi:C4-dicarboxylate-specific signal transduction histidine kinase
MKDILYTFDYIKVPLKDKNGNVVGICGVMRDITERKKAEAAMLEAKEAVARSEKLASLGVMAAGITHEINQPLNSIKLSATGILYWYKHNKQRSIEDIMEEVEEISIQADRIDHIIKHLRSLAHNRESLALRPCDLNKVVKLALDFVGSQLAAHGIEVCELLARELPFILGSLTGLEEAVINLLVNAMQALDLVESVDKKIFIKTEYDTNVVLEISDNGLGIKPEIKEKIFDPFFTTKISGENMGFGLSIVHSTVTSCDGKIDVISDGQCGTTFRLVFPILDLNIV